MECSVLETVAKIYIVDDDPAMRQLLSALVKSMELSPEPFASARDFLEYCTPSDPGCVLLDVRMPEMSGLELLEVMRQQGIPFPVIVLSAHGDVPTAVRAMRAGAINYIE
jgi:two-component system response regulator FixJ